MFSSIVNMKSLMEDPKSHEFAITNLLKTMGLFAVITGHRVALTLGFPAFNAEYKERVRIL